MDLVDTTAKGGAATKGGIITKDRTATGTEILSEIISEMSQKKPL